MVSIEHGDTQDAEVSDGNAHNPFGPALAVLWPQLSTMEWRFPFLHNLASVLVLFLVLTVLVVLYPTVGLCIHLTGIFRTLIADQVAQMRGKATAEKIGYTVSIGVYSLFCCVFGIASLSFFLLGRFVGAIVGADTNKARPNNAYNPFGRALGKVWSQLKTMKWSFLFLHNLVSVVVLWLVIIVMVVLYPTIGLSIHLVGIIRILIADNVEHMARKASVEQIGYSVSITLYSQLFCLFGLIALPFHLLGLLVGVIVDTEASKPSPANAHNSFEQELTDVWLQVKSERRFIFNLLLVLILLSSIALLVVLVRRMS